MNPVEQLPVILGKAIKHYSKRAESYNGFKPLSIKSINVSR